MVADFFCYLHKEKKLALSTIAGYRTAIRQTLRAAGVCDTSQNIEIRELEIRQGKSDQPNDNTSLGSDDSVA